MTYIKNKPFFYVLLIASAACSFIITKAEVVFDGPLQKIGEARSVMFLEDAKKDKFVLKYHRGPEYAIAEALATKMGKSIGININDVTILPPQSPHVKDYIDNQITTLHTHVPGDEVQQTDLCSKIDICGGLANNANLKSVTEDPQLSDIVAVDIFTNNPDRHNGNFFFDSATQQFYAIDMDYTFRREYNIPGRVYHFLSHHQNTNQSFSPQAIEAIKRINEILSKLLYKYTPQQMHKELANLEAITGYTFKNREDFKRFLQCHYCQTKNLHFYLNRLIAANAKNNSFKDRIMQNLVPYISNVKLQLWLDCTDPKTALVELSSELQQLKGLIVHKLNELPKLAVAQVAKMIPV